MTSADPQASAEAVRIAVSALDQAAQEGALHQRSAARRKSRLMKKHSAVLAAAVVAEEKAAPALERKRNRLGLSLGGPSRATSRRKKEEHVASKFMMNSRHIPYAWVWTN